jgi:hypothetical protein
LASKENSKQAHALLTHYIYLFKDKYNRDPILNRYREKWGMQDVIDTVGYERAKDLIEYYFTFNRYNHPLQWFFYNFDKLDKLWKDIEDDKVHRDMLRLKTKEMVEERERRLDEHGSNADISSMQK